MKIRAGFVANSSSASFILKIIGQSPESFVQFLIEQFSLTLDKSRTIETLDKEIKREESASKEDHKTFFKEFYKTRLKTLKTHRSKISKAKNKKDLVCAILDYEGVVFNPKQMTLSAWTIMYNDASSIHEIIAIINSICTASGIQTSLEIINND
jgi:hypothetical protein